MEVLGLGPMKGTIMFYALSTGGFYAKEINGDDMPPDAVELSQQQYQDLRAGLEAGMHIEVDEHGQFVLAGGVSLTDEQLLAVAKGDIDRARDEGLVAGVEIEGVRYHSDDRFLVELMGMIMGYQVGIYTGSQSIRTRDNQIVQLNVQQITALAAAVGTHRKAVYATSWAAKDAL